MKILNAIISGICKTTKAWKGILILWFVSFLMVTLVTGPLRASLKIGFGHSMITELLTDGINIDAIGDLGQILVSVIFSLFSGILILSAAGIISGVFLAGGLFDAVKSGTEKVSVQSFFRASARNFWSFLVISLILYAIVILLFILLIIVPVAITAKPEEGSMVHVLRILKISGGIFMIIAAIIILTADYARAWQVTSPLLSPVKAIGFGFRQAFRRFLSSFPVVVVILIIQGLLLWGVYSLIANYNPVDGKELFLLFIFSQLLFISKLFVKVLRYGSITALMEVNTDMTGEKSPQDAPGNVVQDYQSEYRAESSF